MTLGVPQFQTCARTVMTMKKIPENLRKTSRKGMSLACVPRSQFLVPSISTMSPLISLFAATVHDGVGNRALIARDNTAQPKQRLANQGKTTVLLHDFFWLLVLVPVRHTNTHCLVFESRGVCCLCLTVFSLLLAAVHGAPSNFFTLCPCPFFRYRTDVVAVWWW